MLVAPSPRRRRGRLLALAWIAALAAALTVGPLLSTTIGADPTPSPDPSASASPSPTPAPALVIAFRKNLLRSGDYVHQFTRYQCVGASLQIMRNMIIRVDNRGPWLQKRLWRLARSKSLYRADGGADPFGWTSATGLAGHGRYVLVAAPTMAEAIKAAATGMAVTGRPAGIIVWHGMHAWVLTGFEATADPRAGDDFQVVTVKVADPLWPVRRVLGHRIYRPGTRLFRAVLGRNFTPYHDPRKDPRIEGKFVAIVPLPDAAPMPANAWSPTESTIPTAGPAATPAPTASPQPTPIPTDAPTASPAPTDGPAVAPTEVPTAGP